MHEPISISIFQYHIHRRYQATQKKKVEGRNNFIVWQRNKISIMNIATFYDWIFLFIKPFCFKPLFSDFLNMVIECVDTNPSSAEVWRILFPDCSDGIFSWRPTKKEDDRINGHFVRAKWIQSGRYWFDLGKTSRERKEIWHYEGIYIFSNAICFAIAVIQLKE